MGQHHTAYGQMRESWWQACLTGGGWWRRQRQQEWQGEAEGKEEAVTHEVRDGCGWQTAAGGDDQLTWHIGSYHRRALGQTEGGTRVRGRVTRAAPLPNGQTSVEGRLRNRSRQARCRCEKGPGLRRRRVKVVPPPSPVGSLFVFLLIFFFFFCQIIIKCQDNSDSLTLRLLQCRH